MICAGGFLTFLFFANQKKLSRFLFDLPVIECFGMTVSGGVIGELIAAPNARIARSLVLTWMENFDREMIHATDHQKSVWQRLCESPDGSLIRGQFPYAVTVVFGSAKMFVHREFCLVEERLALGVLRKASFAEHWPALRLLYIGMSDPQSQLSVLPSELVAAIAEKISPHLFMKQIPQHVH